MMDRRVQIGKAYVYSGSGTTYTNAATLAASDPAADTTIFGTQRRGRGLRRHDSNRGRRVHGTGRWAAGEGVPLYRLRCRLRRDETDGLPGILARRTVGGSSVSRWGWCSRRASRSSRWATMANSQTGRVTTPLTADGVIVYRSVNGQYVAASLPEASGIASDRYGTGVAMLAAGDDVTVVAGAPDAGTPPGGGPGDATVSHLRRQTRSASSNRSWARPGPPPPAASGTFNGAPFHLAARALDAFYTPSPPTGVTFTVNAVNGAGGVFSQRRPEQHDDACDDADEPRPQARRRSSISIQPVR